MTRVLVVGSGASGVHFALTALERGFDVTMVDTGFERPASPSPDATVDDLKSTLPDPVGYFIGAGAEGVAYPSTKASYYAHPPSKSYVFRIPGRFASRSHNMEPLLSFARGGLAEAWTAGSYEFNADDLASFPLAPDALRGAYREVARRIGVGAQPDDLAQHIPLDADYLPPLPLDPHSAWLLDRYGTERSRLNTELGFVLGRSRVATLSQEHRGRHGCAQLGRCFWGCPVDAIYSPAVTLADCRRHPRFRYCPGVVVSHFESGADGLVTRVAGHQVPGDERVEFEAELFALAAGALATSKIFLDSLYRATGRIERLDGLMDNRQIHLPFLTPSMIGRPAATAAYQYHHLAFGLTMSNAAEYVHGQITTLKAAAIHPIVQSLPLDTRGALAAFRAVRTGLAIANINLHDTRRSDCYLSIRPTIGDSTELVVEYRDDPTEAAAITTAVGRVKRALRRLGSLVPPGMTRVLPKGASVHYAGTLPMSASAGSGRFTCTPEGRSRDFANLYIADGATFPFLPAKNLTFTLMANAHRVAEGLPA